MADVGSVPDLPAPRWPLREGSCPAGPGPEIRDHAQLIQLIALGRTCALMPQPLAATLADGYAVVPVPDAPPVTTVLAWPAHLRTTAVAELNRAAEQLSRMAPAT
jgi:DNA-binding transcriptional LysR family regulator